MTEVYKLTEAGCHTHKVTY